MTTEMIVQLVTGPASALGLAVLIILAGFKLIAMYLPPIIQRHMQQVDKIATRLEELKISRDDNAAIMNDAIAGLHTRLNPIESDVSVIKAIVVKNASQPVAPVNIL